MSMTLTMLGTGNALVTEVYNTCFVIREDDSYFMVDGGGGSSILSNLKHAGFDWQDMRDIFVTHKHIDHLTGIIWMMRMICQHMREGSYEGEARIYAHAEVIDLLKTLADLLLTKKETCFIGTRLHMIVVEDGETKMIAGHDITFFDIGSTKARQFGFMMDLGDGKKLTCCGDEPYNPCEESYAKGSTWLLHEAFCLYDQADIFHPYEKHHSTAKDAAQLAESLGVKNLLLYHTEDRNIADRKALYTKEAKDHFGGNVFVPEDLEVITIL